MSRTLGFLENKNYMYMQTRKAACKAANIKPRDGNVVTIEHIHTDNAFKCQKVQFGYFCRFLAMKYAFTSMDLFHIAAFVAFSKLIDLSQNISNVVSRVVVSHSCI